MKAAIIAFAFAVVLAFGGAVFAQTDTTMSPSPSPSPTTMQPEGAPSTGFGGSH